ncbi:MAG: DNA adenine methylase [Kiritimatiellae bacterium]|nr:DNA adenine methylase [Kiritimatiellia bacterium]
MNNVFRTIGRFAIALVLIGLSLIAQGGETVRARPFVKWAGGKGQLLRQLDALLPSDFAHRENIVYVEPFVGGAAMLLHVLSKYPNISQAIINDANFELIATYETIKDRPEELIERLRKLQDDYLKCETEAARQRMYLKSRAEFNMRTGDELEMSALFIFLNKTCFNGLYRVNSKGEFNVPFGKAKNPPICDAANIRALSRALQKVTILKGDFADVLGSVKGKAFFYFDPPYRPLTQSAAFTAYAKGGFGDDEQRRLAQFCRKLDRAGHQWLLSNSDPHNVNPDDDFFEELYQGFVIKRVTASRAINAKGDGRGKIKELAIRNYID